MSSYREEESYLIIPFLRAWIIFAPSFTVDPQLLLSLSPMTLEEDVPQTSPWFPILMQEEHAHTNESSPKKLKTTEDKLSRINGTCSCLTGQAWAQKGTIYRDAFPLGGAVSFICISATACSSSSSFLIVVNLCVSPATQLQNLIPVPQGRDSGQKRPHCHLYLNLLPCFWAPPLTILVY